MAIERFMAVSPDNDDRCLVPLTLSASLAVISADQRTALPVVAEPRELAIAVAVGLPD
jgi:hypothetical protein